MNIPAILISYRTVTPGVSQACLDGSISHRSPPTPSILGIAHKCSNTTSCPFCYVIFSVDHQLFLRDSFADVMMCYTPQIRQFPDVSRLVKVVFALFGINFFPVTTLRIFVKGDRNLFHWFTILVTPPYYYIILPFLGCCFL